MTHPHRPPEKCAVRTRVRIDHVERTFTRLRCGTRGAARGLIQADAAQARDAFLIEQLEVACAAHKRAAFGWVLRG